MKRILSILTLITMVLFSVSAIAADKVVVIPLGGKKSVSDPNLVSGNIKAGTTIFGVTGKTEVVDTTSGDATASDLKLNKAAWVDGEEVTGTLTGGTELKAGGSFSPGGRWYDNNDGTITDTTTGLVWLKNIGWGIQVPFDFYCPTCIGDPGYDVFNTLFTLHDGVGGLTDGSAAGDWGAPTKSELQGLMVGAEPVSYGNQGLFTGIANDVYWTTTTGASVVWQVLVVDLADTNLDQPVQQSKDLCFWCGAEGQYFPGPQKTLTQFARFLLHQDFFLVKDDSTVEEKPRRSGEYFTLILPHRISDFIQLALRLRCLLLPLRARNSPRPFG